MIKVDSICEIAKSIKAAAQKSDGGPEVINCELKFSDLPITRDVIDELLGLPVGWSQASIFDDQGAPLRMLWLGVRGRVMSVTGTISGPKGEPSLNLVQAELSDVSLALTTLGAVVDGKLTWPARGNEVEDVMELFGKTCRAVWQIVEGEQQEMFPPSQAVASAASRRVIDLHQRRPE